MIAQIRTTASMSSRTLTKKEYKCDICRDTGWIQGEKGSKKCVCSRKEVVDRMWKAYGVNPAKVKKINDYKTHDKVTQLARDRAVDYVYDFANTKSSDNNWICFLGQPGSGKTHLAIAIGATLLSQNIQVVYMPYTEVTQELKGNAIDIQKYTKLSNRYKFAEVLLIDDLFKDKVRSGEIVGKLTEVDMKHIYPLLNYRYNNNLPTIISSECTPQMLLELDDALGSRILEKALNRITVFTGSNYNYRVKNIMK